MYDWINNGYSVRKRRQLRVVEIQFAVWLLYAEVIAPVISRQFTADESIIHYLSESFPLLRPVRIGDYTPTRETQFQIRQCTRQTGQAVNHGHL